MEDEWEDFIAEAKAKGYDDKSNKDKSEDSDDSGADEPITIISQSTRKTSSTVPTKEPEDAEEAVRQAGIGMSGLNIHANAPEGRTSKKQKEEQCKEDSIPPLTPQAYSRLSPPKDEMIYDELAVVDSVGLYPHRSFHIANLENHTACNLPKLPSSMFLTMNTMSSSSSVGPGIQMSFSHLFTIVTCLPPLNSTPFMMQFSKTDTSLLFSSSIHVPYYGDRAASYLSLYLPTLHLSLTPLLSHRASLGGVDVSITGLYPVSLHIPNSIFSENLTAVIAGLIMDHRIAVGRLDPLTGSVHAIQSIIIEISNSLALRSFGYVMERLWKLPPGDYTLVHRAGADNLIICKERECTEEIVITDLPLNIPPISLDKLNQ